MRRLLVPLACVLLLSAAEAADGVVAYEIVNASEIPASLTGQPGDPQAGRRLYFDTRLARCLTCHGAPDGAGEGSSAPAREAPSLAAVGKRLTEGEIRLWLVAPQVLAPGTAMPAYYAVGQRDEPTDPRYGEPLLTAGQIEDLVAYLMRQTDPR